MNNKTYAFLVVTLLCCLLQAKKLVMVHQIFRHGARYPYTPMKNDFSDYTMQQGLRGELTSQGKHMQYILGKIMYDNYWNQLFADTEYANKYHPSQIYVRSTNFNRTIESVEAQLLGLLQKLPPYELPVTQIPNSLPPNLKAMSYQDTEENSTTFKVYGKMNAYFHLAPIHQVAEIQARSGARYKYRANPYDQGDFLTKYDEQNCPNQMLWARQNIVSEKAMRIKNSEQVKTFLDKLSAAVNSKVKFQDALHYWDDYVANKFQSRKRLELFQDPATYKIADFISLASTILNGFHTQIQIKAVSTRLIQTIVNNMKQAIIKKGPRMVLYSAHDTTILMFATALNFTNINCLMQYFYEGKNNNDTCINQYPTFATNFIIELWEEDNFSHTIKILYNGVQKKIPICDYQTSCSFAGFQKWAEDFYVDDPNDVCGIREQYAKLYIVIAVLSVFLVIFIVVQMHSRLKKKMQKTMQEMQEKKGYLQHFEQKEIEFASQKHHELQT